MTEAGGFYSPVGKRWLRWNDETTEEALRAARRVRSRASFILLFLSSFLCGRNIVRSSIGRFSRGSNVDAAGERDGEMGGRESLTRTFMAGNDDVVCTRETDSELVASSSFSFLEFRDANFGGN